jgi:uncharacterized protein YndB with AHSA1/START domain
MSVEKPATVPALEVRRRVPAPPQVVFDYWTDPEQVRHWLGGSAMNVPHASIDLRVGGEYEYKLLSPEGVNSRILGTFLAIQEPKQLIYTWIVENDAGRSPKTTVSIEFLDLGDETEIVIVHEGFLDLGVRAAHEEGWGVCFDALIPLFN